MTPATELITFGKRMAQSQGVREARPDGEWLAYGQACHDALRRGKTVPVLRPVAPPPPPPAPPTATIPAALPRAVVSARASAVAAAAPRPRGKGNTRGAVAAASRQGLCAVCAQPVQAATVVVEEPRPGRGWAGRLAWGLLWRYALAGAVLVAAESRAGTPWAVVVAMATAGLLLGLWHRRGLVARVWRALALAGIAVYVGPLLSVYPDILAGSLGALTLSPIVDNLRDGRR